MVAGDVYVPSERVLLLDPDANRRGSCASEMNKGLGLYRIPAQTFVLTSVGTFCGLSRAALELLLRGLPNRGIMYTFYDDRSAAPVTHLQVAEAATKIRAAHHLFFENADRIDRHVDSGEAFEAEEQALMWGNAGCAVRLCVEAIDVIRLASGASAISESNPIQQVVRDLQALSSHAYFLPTTTLEIYGRIMCGQTPNTPYL